MAERPASCAMMRPRSRYECERFISCHTSFYKPYEQWIVDNRPSSIVRLKRDGIGAVLSLHGALRALGLGLPTCQLFPWVGWPSRIARGADFENGSPSLHLTPADALPWLAAVSAARKRRERLQSLEELKRKFEAEEASKTITIQYMEVRSPHIFLVPTARAGASAGEEKQVPQASRQPDGLFLSAVASALIKAMQHLGAILAAKGAPSDDQPSVTSLSRPSATGLRCSPGLPDSCCSPTKASNVAVSHCSVTP